MDWLLTLRFMRVWGGGAGEAEAQLADGSEQGHVTVAELASVLDGFNFPTSRHVGSLHSLLISGTWH